MILKKRKVLLIFTGIILLHFFSPFYYFKTNTNIETQNKLNDKNVDGSTTKIESHIKGISWNEKEIDFKNDNRFTVNKSSLLNLGIYSKLTLELSLERLVGNKKIKTNVKAESIIWGLGKLRNKKNNFNNSIIKRIDEIYSGN
ncbi:hypothetical protein [Thalassobellus sediminis]|uniref:hypothetical protein n=1 Tax=Thalassobellus sediminis TaxID=3367753 RepID=UPI0037B20FEF